MKKYSAHVDIVKQDDDILDPANHTEFDVTVWGRSVRDGGHIEEIGSSVLRKALKCKESQYIFMSCDVRNIIQEKYYKAEWVDENDFPSCDYYLHGYLTYRKIYYYCTIEISEFY